MATNEVRRSAHRDENHEPHVVKFSNLVVKRISRLQPNAEGIGSRKPKVDNPMESAYISTVDICLLSFGYRALGTVP
ncbi:hypothetical protein [Shinella sp. BYT-45]|uniref:hypothetical protein n=1 Tax=Shinella sp. BYT-45 TaxID=3377377 RepID=UPI00397F0390